MKEFRNTILQLQTDIEFCRSAMECLIKGRFPEKRAEFQQRICNCIGQAGDLAECLADAVASRECFGKTVMRKGE